VANNISIIIGHVWSIDCQSIDWLIDWLIHWSVNHCFIDQSIFWSINCPVDQSIDWSINQSSCGFLFWLTLLFLPFPSTLWGEEVIRWLIASSHGLLFGWLSSFCPFPWLCEERKWSDNWLQLAWSPFWLTLLFLPFSYNLSGEGSDRMIDCKQPWSPYWPTLLFSPFPWLCKEKEAIRWLIAIGHGLLFGQLSSFCPFPWLCEESKRLDNRSQLAMVSFLAGSPLFALSLDFARKGSNRLQVAMVLFLPKG